MSVDNHPAAPDPGPRTSLHLLADEATKQLNICNACRYCEGLCAVFPALERRSLLEGGDISQIANLCHDCRACYDACMYTPPHEFAINLPRVLSAVRLKNYQEYMWPRRAPWMLRGWPGIFLGAILSTLLVGAIAVLHGGWSVLVSTDNRAQSPYVLIPHDALLALTLAAGAFAVAVMVLAGCRYWVDVGRNDEKRVTFRAVVQATWYAATLRYLRGGGQDCYYPSDDRPSPSRRTLHSLVAYGFGLCAVSTTAAAVLQNILRHEPPYPWYSVPVVSGTIGGIGLVVGSIGLLLLKARSSAVTSIAAMTVKDYGLLVALTFLALSGLATLLTRSTAAFGVVFLIHLASVLQAFASAPYSKFVHLMFRFLAIVRDNVERDGGR